MPLRSNLFGDDERPTLVAFPEPIGEATSSLHDLFGGGSNEAAAGALTFTRPQQPPQPSERSAAAEPAAASGSTTLYGQLVQVFQDVGGAWQPVGQSGLALVGGPAPAAYQMVLYDASNKKPFSVTTVATLTLTPQRAQYLSFVDGQARALPRASRTRSSTLANAPILERAALRTGEFVVALLCRSRAGGIAPSPSPPRPSPLPHLRPRIILPFL